ncbi:putative reverse transcriptase domain-containing protein [Tanacetum coccineum]
MAASHSAIMFVATLFVLPASIFATEYIVGDQSGWNLDYDYQAWAKDTIFYVGDSHNVVKVNGTAVILADPADTETKLRVNGSRYGTGFLESKEEWGWERLKPPESNKRDDVNFNANVEPTPSASLPASVSFATLLKRDTSQKSVNFRTLIIPTGNEADVVVLLESIRAVSERFANAAYGLFWESGWLTSFSKDRLDAMLENGPWFIRNNPLILKKWNPNVNFSKEDVANVPVWVKLHGVPMTTFSEDGLKVISTKLGTPLMLDSYTSDMCMQS